MKSNIIDEIGYVELLDNMGNDKRVVDAARVSFNRDNPESNQFDEKDDKLVKYLLENKHTSPLEHVLFTFLIKAPLFVRSQWMRHRAWSYNEISRRYTDENIEFYIPKTLRKQSENNKQASTDDEIKTIVAYGEEVDVYDFLEKHSRYCERVYNILLENEVSREQARMALPQNLYTKYYATVDLHNLLHFIEIRNHPHAQYEMRKFAETLQTLAERIVPNTMKIWKRLKNG